MITMPSVVNVVGRSMLSTALTLAAVGVATAQQPAPDVSSLRLHRADYAQWLINDQHEYLQIQGVAGVYYAYGAYMRGIGACGLAFKTIEIPFWQLTFGREVRPPQTASPNVLSSEEFSRELVAVANSDYPIRATLEFGVGFISAAEAIAEGQADLEAIVSEFGCGSPTTRRWVAVAEKLVEKLLMIRQNDRWLLTRYVRPALLDGLPEETKQLYDGYHLCRVREGQTDHLASFGPCDDALFQLRVSEARATGQPVPTPRLPPIRPWTSERGPTGELQERSYGTDIRFSTAPADFTPEIPDTRAIKLPLVFYLDFNDGIRDKLSRVSLTGINHSGVYGLNPMRFQGAARDRVSEDYTALMSLGFEQVLDCTYYVSERRAFSVYYWYRSRPALADPARLRSRVANHPLFLILGVREDCPATVNAETKAQIQAMLRRN